MPLDEQDRALWDRAAIDRGRALLVEALSLGPPNAHTIEAAVQALHDEAPTYEATDYPQIARLYAMLRACADSPAAARADLLRRLGRTVEARAAYDRAIRATKNEVE